MPEAVVTSKKINTFKARLERWWKEDEEKHSYEPTWTLSPKQTRHTASRQFDAVGADGELQATRPHHQ